MEPIVGIGTVLVLDSGEFTVIAISGRRVVNSRGNYIIEPQVTVRQTAGKGYHQPLVLHGSEIEAALS